MAELSILELLVNNSLAEIFAKAQNRSGDKPSVIAFAEAQDERIIQAAQELLESKVALPVIIADDSSIDELKQKATAKIKQCSIADLPANGSSDALMVVNISDADNVETLQQIQREEKNNNHSNEPLSPITAAALLLANDKFDGMIAGATCPTAKVIKAGLKLVGLAPNIKTVSSCFLMLADNGPLIFADCAVVPQPNPQQLADIAVASADVYTKLFGAEAKVAFLSFSTKGSAKHSEVDKVQDALKLLADRKVSFAYDGELQFDAAIDEAVASNKAPDSAIAGKANVFIFPDLNSGNIGYKIAQRLGDIPAIGPIIMGLKRPLMDLSRGCSKQDIINLAAITSVLAKSQ